MAPINRITEADVADFGRNASLSLYQRVATKSAIYPGQGTALGLAYVGLKLNGEAGEFAEHVGKAMRDDQWFGVFEDEEGNLDDGVTHAWERPLSDERRDLIIKEIGDVLWYLSAACNELGIDLAEAAYTNLCKLCDRANRGVLQGSGDER